tara:strand:- start:226 stop:828 length:603 start_codon:yes stop_codon:yes gene_type:complete
MVLLNIEATSQYCNHWPTLVINHNGVQIFSDVIAEQKTIELELESIENQQNTLQVGMKGKMFGDKGVFDTVVTDGVITEDLQINLQKVTLDQVDIMDLLTRNDYTVDIVPGMKPYHKTKFKANGELAFNGYYVMEYELPLFKYLTNAKWKKPADDGVSYFSNHTMVFHYEEQKKEMQETELILKEIDEKFSDIRTKIRNT